MQFQTGKFIFITCYRLTYTVNLGMISFKLPSSLGCCQFYGGGSVVVYLLFLYLPLFVEVLCWSLILYALLCVLSSLAIILTKKRELVALLLSSVRCLITVNVLWL